MSAANLVHLNPQERVRHDSGPVLALYKNLDAASADQVVTRALAEMGLAVASLSHCISDSDLGDLDRRLRQLQSLAQNIGMTSMERVAGDLRICHGRRDDTGFAAVWARLCRVAEQSLASDRHFADQSL